MKDKIRNYISRMNIEDVNAFAVKNGIYLSRSEMEFTYNFIKNNYSDVLENKNYDFGRYKEKFSTENFPKVQRLIEKYRNYL